MKITVAIPTCYLDDRVTNIHAYAAPFPLTAVGNPSKLELMRRAVLFERFLYANVPHTFYEALIKMIYKRQIKRRQA